MFLDDNAQKLVEKIASEKLKSNACKPRNGQKLISPPSPVVIVTGEGIFVLYYDTFILKIDIFTKQKKLCIIKMLHKTT